MPQPERISPISRTEVVTAKRNTSRPFIWSGTLVSALVTYGVGSSARYCQILSGAGSALSLTAFSPSPRVKTAAPAPSPNRTQVERSCQEVIRVGSSAQTTSTFSTLPARK